MIIADPRNPRASELRDALLERIPEQELPTDLHLVFGGDGFMLHTIAAHGFDDTYLGLNAGHLGFLMNEAHNLELVATMLRERAFKVHAYPLLEATVHSPDGRTQHAVAVNDLYVQRDSGQTARLSLAIDGHEVVDSLVADGVVFATALGTTAYTFSAGGTPCHPEIPILAVTPICPHQPRLSPFILPARKQAQILVQVPERRPVRAVADGRDLGLVTRVEVGVGEKTVRLAYAADHDFTSELVRKIIHP